jgi:hypothetical protein
VPPATFATLEKNPVHARVRTAGPSRPRWPARREQAAIYSKYRQVASERQQVNLSFFEVRHFAVAEISEMSERIGIRRRALEAGS